MNKFQKVQIKADVQEGNTRIAATMIRAPSEQHFILTSMCYNGFISLGVNRIDLENSHFIGIVRSEMH